MNKKGLSGPRALVFGCLFGIVFWGVVLFLVLVGTSKADHMACSHPAFSWPRTVAIAPDAPNPAAWRGALADWNRQGSRVRFQEVPYGSEADVYVLSSWYWSNGKTWVNIPCNRTDSIVYAGTDVDLNYWAAHEMGHTLGLADHITHSTNPANYMNPKFCPEDYSGIMSYCTPRSSWWGAPDQFMLWWWF